MLSSIGVFFFFLFPYFNDCKPDNDVFVKKIARLTQRLFEKL